MAVAGRIREKYFCQQLVLAYTYADLDVPLKVLTALCLTSALLGVTATDHYPIRLSNGERRWLDVAFCPRALARLLGLYSPGWRIWPTDAGHDVDQHDDGTWWQA